MNVVLQRRAEIALRSLGQAEQSRINRELKAVGSASPDALRQNGELRKLATPSDENMYSYPVSHQWYLVLSIEDDTYVVQDVLARERLKQLFSREPLEETTVSSI